MLEASFRCASSPAFSGKHAPRRAIKHSRICRPVCAQTPEHQPGITRRKGMAVAAASALLAAGQPNVAEAAVAPAPAPSRAPFQLPPLPYAMDALEPVMSAKTLSFHSGKHHAAYCANLNNQIKGNPELENLTLEEVMLKTWNGGKPAAPFNNAAQVVNHTFFFESMRPNGGGQPKGKLLAAINRDFGSFEAFKEQFKKAGATQFGSGWAWLVVGKEGKLKVTKTPNAENPWVAGENPILTCDVWEHAYYLDTFNRRPEYIEGFVEKLINWDKVAERYARAA